VSRNELKRAVYVISDGTGETAMSMVRAALVQFTEADVAIVRCKNVRTDAHVESVMQEASDAKGFVVFTVVSPSLRHSIEAAAQKHQVIAVDLLGPLLSGLASYIGGAFAPEAGRLRVVDARYFRRIEAIEYTVKHDDGKELRDLDKADIILVGVSRTSKTPLSMFLSHKGWKVANVPIVMHVPLPAELFAADQRKVVALTIDSHKLQLIRQKRAEKMGDPGSDYAHAGNVFNEGEYALALFQQNKRWPVLDVTDRALEETAAEIIRIVGSRTGRGEDPD
jgi:regulator of PEP synthase PpsR (kinase-PPPase family)